MRYNFKRLSGSEWFDTIRQLKGRGLTFLERRTDELYDKTKVDKIYYAYYARTATSCKVVYYDWNGEKWKKQLRQISFSPREIDPIKCVLTFRKIAKSFNELVPYEPHRYYSNGIYTYYTKAYVGYVSVFDMNSAYLYALTQPLADWETRTEVSVKEVFDKSYDYYCFENSLHSEMFYKEDIERMTGAMLWADVKIYGYKAKLYYQQTARELYRLKCEVNKERYKNVANIAVGCMHKRSGTQNNTTLAASIYAWFAWYIDSLVKKFKDKKYKVIMITTDSIKIQGKYNYDDNIIKIGDGLGEFKLEYEGLAKYYSTGHYEENKSKWKGKPEYMRRGYNKCLFVENLEKEKEIYENFTIT